MGKIRRFVMIDINILSCVGIDVTKIQSIELEDETINEIVIGVKLKRNILKCPYCANGKVYIKDYYRKIYRFFGLMSKTLCIVFYQRRYKCLCGKTFMEENLFNKGTDYKLTKNIRIAIIKMLQQGLTCKAISSLLNISETIVYKVLDSIQPKRGNIGTVLCIDEFARIRVDGKLVYSAIVVNGDKNELIDILPTRKKECIIDFFLSISPEKRQLIKVVTMDMWVPYKEAVKLIFPNALIIIDKFHFISYATKCIDKVRIRIMKKYNKGSYEYYLLKKYGTKLLIKNVDNYHYRYKVNFKTYKFKAYENEIINIITKIDPEIEWIYTYLHAFVYSYNNRSYETARKEILKLINVLRSKDIEEGIALADVYENWYEEICNSFIKFGSKTYNNAICEGINNKIKAIKRSSFGILNFSHLRARVFLSFRNMTPEKNEDF